MSIQSSSAYGPGTGRIGAELRLLAGHDVGEGQGKRRVG